MAVNTPLTRLRLSKADRQECKARDIFTVEELAQVSLSERGQLSMKALGNAQSFVKLAETQKPNCPTFRFPNPQEEKPDESHKVATPPAVTHVKPKPPDINSASVFPQKLPVGGVSKKSQPASYYMLERHSWFELYVRLPTEHGFTDAVIHELSLEPNNRVSLLCSWHDTSCERSASEVMVCKMTYSLPFIAHFNAGVLPKFVIDVKLDELKSIPEGMRYACENSVYEANLILNFHDS